MSNQYTLELRRMLSERYSVESVGMTTGEWMCANTKVKGKSFNFQGYEFQRTIADDLHPNLDVIKISQVGLTEIQSRKALAFLIRNPGVTGIFSLPNEKMYRRFSQSRLKPMIEENRVFRPTSSEAPVRSMDLMQFGMSFLNVVNATEASATGIPADLIFNDEVDLSDQKILALFSSRLQNSSYKIKQRFSTPSWTGFGIDGTFGVSDQREYFCKCFACNTHQVPLFSKEFVYLPGLPDSVPLHEITDNMHHKLRFDEAFVMCHRCGAPLDLGNSAREWVATYPTRTENRGYRVRPFTSSRISISYIIQQLLDYQRKDYVRGWWNTVIGEAYTDARARLDESAIKACMDTPGPVTISPTAPVYMGMDMGQVCHMTLATPAPGDCLHVFEFRSFPVEDVLDVLAEVMANYNLINGCCDRHPYTPTADAMHKKSEGRIFPVEYRGEQELKAVRDVSDSITYWQANRTRLLDDVARHVRERKYIMTGYGLMGSILITHLRDQIREESVESPAKWVKLTGNDHFAHSLAFLQAATKIQDTMQYMEKPDLRCNITIGGIKLQI